ncbi:Septation initiation network scaffold protein cdc11 [Pseudocercospora fuligena]|uniref:Septation initiation network scaffold protein cdc11 n=1 Tax=Pseudocercospora fuligena TaxID=685502 RepID=A0A8H6VNB6_9PEZI|nr:Septation initiation network scaffold protein cdc11 [Pseudocercospora fuligena]
MSNIAPWLQGLDEAWEIPASLQAQNNNNNISSATHDAHSIRTGSTRVQRQLSQKTTSQTSTQKRRHPLATLTSSGSNSIRRQRQSSKLTASRSFSGTSEDSVLQYAGTVAQRSKSASPTKKQETLEWKRRLLKGQLGYGDQTDLFGANGLENIFAQKPEPEAKPKIRSSMSWLNNSSFADMPSSPPLWKRHDDYEAGQEASEERLTAVAEEVESQQHDRSELDGDSFRSNPFALDESDPPVIQDSFPEESAIVSPERLEPTEHNMVGNRTVSGQTECEDFSPVFISKHTTMDGKTDYKAFDSHYIKKFQDMELQRPSQENSEEDTPCPDEVSQAQDESAFTDGLESDLLQVPNAAPDLSLSENLPTGTPPSVANLCGNVQFRRGGYSAQGSWKERPLSASQSSAEPAHVRDASGLLSPIPSSGPNKNARLSPNLPSTPVQQHEPSEPKSKSSGSPLKLFGPHDTFTSNRLLRRMSQLDPDLSSLSEQHEADQGREKLSADRKVSGASFGSGSLSHHKFNAEITITSASDSDKQNSDRSPGSDIPPPGARSPVIFNLNTSPITKENTFKLKRRRSALTSAGSTMNATSKKKEHLQPTVEDATDLSKAFEQPSEISVAAGKRPRNSPYKAPTPKRRRTLHASELEAGTAEMNRSYHDNLQDALAASKATSNKIEQLQDALRPRNPTPSQRRREQIEAEIRETAEQFVAEEPERLEAVMEQIESSMATASPPSMHQQARTVANEVAKFSLRVQKASGDMTERKRSVTTQDFFNEAVMVMRLIREKAGRQSGLGSVAESDQEGNSGFEGSNPDPSALRISRPPSREIASGWRSRNSEHTDARVMSHLRKFQEKDDTEFIAQSVASLHMDDEAADEVDEDAFDDFEDSIVAVDEHSNIRIRGPMPEYQQEDDDSRPTSQRSNQTQSTQHSSATSTGRTLHTTSTRKSENVGTLAPDAVAHLIGEQVGSMYFDRNRQQWVKSKSPEKRKSYGSFLEPPSNITSDDDPFREISDLPVDERKEEEIRKTSSQGRRVSVLPGDGAVSVPEVHDFAEEEQIETRTTSQETVLARTVTSESHKSRHTYSSSDPSRCTNTAFGSSQQQIVETRATSWGDDDLQRLAAQGKARHQPLAYAAAQAALQQRSQGSMLARPQSADTQKSFFPPQETITEERESMLEDDEEDVGDETLEEVNGNSMESAALPDDTEYVQELREHIESPKLRKSPARATVDSGHRDTTIRSTRKVSLRRKTLTSRFTQQDELEQSELSFIAPLPGDRIMSVSLSVSRPLSRRQPYEQANALFPSSPIKFDSNHILSDLPDFTVHEEDHERPTERALAKRLAKHAADEVNDRYALTIKDLVKTLTNVKQHEPHWEKTKQLDLHDQGLRSVYGLNDFCGGLQDMDVSGNDISYLEGAPGTLRNLIAKNCLLSSLTPWTHLMNLQYLDISGNQLDNLTGLECLIHLRELRADDNNIESLDGILGLDGLLKLRARRNKLCSLDLEYSQWQRLEELDLCDNEICHVRGLDMLERLQTLRLDGNHFTVPFETGQQLPNLKHLSLQDCGLRHLNTTSMPALRTLQLDRNRLMTVFGMGACKQLDVLSMRCQSLPQKGQRLQILERPLHARTVRLSGNNVPSLDLPDSLLSMQHLELASAGLQELPDDFGLKLPNLVTLNLNFNSLKDIRPLLNSQKLEKLTVCGNRLERLRKSVATLSKIPTLRELDLRDNILTQGFYAPITATPAATIQTSVVRRDSAHTEEQDEDETREQIEVAKYVLPSQPSREIDTTHHDRLDESTKLRRRVCHLMLGHSCHCLSLLDGLPFEKKDAMVKDRIWDRLVELGIMKKSGKVGLRNETP